MKYTIEKKLEIGKEIYTGNLKIHEAAIKYDIGTTTARECMRLYRDANNLPSRNETDNPKVFTKTDKLDYSDLESFKSNYCMKIFDGNLKSISIEPWTGSIYE